MACTNCGGDKRTYLANGDGISFSGAGTYTSPYVPHLAGGSAGALALEVRDSDTINFTLYGSGLPGDPLILTGDTSSATRLATLGDVAANPGPDQGRTPMWIGTPGGGHFELRTPGTRYTTHADRGNGLYQGEVIRETDTGDRLEWDGTQWVSLVPVAVAPTALDASVLQNKGTLDSSTDWNTLTSGSGIYRIGNGVSSTNNAPSGAYGFGTLEVVKSGNSVTQRYNTHNSPQVYTRTKWNDTDWTMWGSFVTNGDLQAEASARATGNNNLQNQINAEATARAQQDNGLSSAITQLRADTTNSDNDIRSRVNGLESTAATTFVPAAGWTVNRANFWAKGQVLTMDLSLKRTGGSIASGNILNIKMGDVGGGYGSAGYVALSSGPGGTVSSFYVNITGVYLAATTATIANNSEVTCGGTWVRS